jgi:hypothetical protein
VLLQTVDDGPAGTVVLLTIDAVDDVQQVNRLAGWLPSKSSNRLFQARQQQPGRATNQHIASRNISMKMIMNMGININMNMNMNDIGCSNPSRHPNNGKQHMHSASVCS